MIAVDTEVVLDFLTERGGDPRQLESKNLVIRESKKSGVYISYAVLFELAEILESLDKARIIATFSAILQTAGLIVENGPTVADALDTYRHSTASLADCMKLASAASAGVTQFYTRRQGLITGDELAASP